MFGRPKYVNWRSLKSNIKVWSDLKILEITVMKNRWLSNKWVCGLIEVWLNKKSPFPIFANNDDSIIMNIIQCLASFLFN
jgi:hypothetical protein